jgi:DNA-damage-inducible protein J
MRETGDKQDWVLIPNEETIEAIKAARRGELTTFKSIEDLLADLHADD